VNLDDLEEELQKNADLERAVGSQRYFKTGKDEYGEGDIFLGLSTPVLMGVIKKYYDLTLDDLQKLLNSKIHEYRSAALVILCKQFKRAGEQESGRVKERIYNFYLKNTKNINNWDLVDISCPTVIGGYLLDKDRSILYKLSVSDLLWERRISIISTLTFIRQNQFDDTLKIAEILLNDKEDLIHKAVGWMLREVGKKDIGVLEEFLLKYGTKMPRTMLRYAIEKFPEEKRKFYLTRKLEK
jgi:3-methyladenine DNA glycosylase AlkD